MGTIAGIRTSSTSTTNAYHPYSYWVQQMYATTTADTAWPVTVEGPSTLRRTLPDTRETAHRGQCKADLNNLTITTAAGDD